MIAVKRCLLPLLIIGAISLAGCGGADQDDERSNSQETISSEQQDTGAEDSSDVDAQLSTAESQTAESLTSSPSSSSITQATAESTAESSDSEAVEIATSAPLVGRSELSDTSTSTSTTSTAASSSASTAQSTTESQTTTQRTTTLKTTTPKSTTSRTTTQRPAAGAFLSVNFQQSPIGTYGDSQVRAEWPNVRWTKVGDRAKITQEGSNRFVRVAYPKGQVGNSNGGAQWAIDLGANAGEELYASYRLRFVGDFDPVLGGKLPGLAGGKGNTGGQIPTGRDGWSARIMWRADNAAVQYVYHPDQPGKWGEDLKWKQPFPKAQWVTVETRIKMNTPGRKDGVVQSWMNGQLVLSRTDIRFRDVNSFAVDEFYFSTFFGGSGSEWAPTKDEYIDYDDFAISRSPITH